MATMTTTCTAPACDRGAIARGLCQAHYQRQRRGRSLDEPIRPPGDGQQIVVRCRRGLVERLRTRADAAGLSLSATVRLALEMWLTRGED